MPGSRVSSRCRHPEVEHEEAMDMTDLNGLPRPDSVTVYGIDACDDTTRALRHLEAAGLPHRYVKLDEDTAANDQLTGAGYHATPVVVTPTGRVFVEPSDAELVAIVESISAGTSATNAR
jgi:glutaredoxin